MHPLVNVEGVSIVEMRDESQQIAKNRYQYKPERG